MRTLTLSLYFIHVGLQAQFIMGRNKECIVCWCVAAFSQSLAVLRPPPLLRRTHNTEEEDHHLRAAATKTSNTPQQQTLQRETQQSFPFSFSFSANEHFFCLFVSLSVKGFNSLIAWPCSLPVFFSPPPPPSCAVVLNSGVKKPWGRAATWTMTGVCVLRWICFCSSSEILLLFVFFLFSGVLDCLLDL